MKRYYQAFLLFFIFLFSIGINAQEVLLDLETNPHIYGKTNNFHQKTTTAVKLPFFDDFANYWNYPNPDLWQDDAVFINVSYGYKPKTIGVATFDALNAKGNIYAHASSNNFAADSLTSLPIRLDSLLDGSMQSISAADSVYFSFCFQPGGMGDQPETDDSLVLEFYAPSQDKWYHIWSSPGMSLFSVDTMYGSFFPEIFIPIVDSMFLQKGFQFRFRNYASISNNNYPSWAGNVDHWNIDYVYLDINRSKNDTIFEDVAFNDWKSTLLKNYYAMPWNQYLANAAFEMTDMVEIGYTNYSNTTINLTKYTKIYELSQGGSSPYNPALTASNVNPLSSNTFTINPLPYSFSSSVTENAEFEVIFAINTNTISDLSRKNDSIKFYQRFYNYYAYDDGTAESGYGVNGNSAKLAYQFTLNTPDTLRAIDMFFNQTQNNASQQFFYLSIWDDNSGQPGNLIYEQSGVRPEYEEGLNQFHTYVLDDAIPLSGTFYIGYRKTNNDFLHLGYDKNTDKKDKVFFNPDGNWYHSMYEGALMIRPILGDKNYPHLSIEEEKTEVSIYPNPAKNHITIDVDKQANIILYNVNGAKILEQEIFNSTKLNLSSFSSGLYYVQTIQDDGINVQKIIINK